MVVIVYVKTRIAPHAVLRVTCFGIIARVCVPVRGRACARVCVCACIWVACALAIHKKQTDSMNRLWLKFVDI